MPRVHLGGWIISQPFFLRVELCVNLRSATTGGVQPCAGGGRINRPPIGAR